MTTEQQLVSELQANYSSMGKIVYDRADRFQEDHGSCYTDSSSNGRVWTVYCQAHDAVVVFEE